MEEKRKAIPVASPKQKTAYIRLSEQAAKAINAPVGAEGAALDSDLLHVIHEFEVQQPEPVLQSAEFRQTQRAPGDSCNQYRRLYDSAPFACVSIDSEGIVTLANQAAQGMFARDGVSLVGTSFVRRVLSADHFTYFSCLKRAGENGGGQGCEVRCTLEDGSVIDVRLEAVPNQGQDDDLSGWHLALWDISGQKAAEKAIHQGELHKITGETAATILQSITDGFMSLDSEWRITYFNDAGVRMLGIRKDELIGGCLWDLFPHATSSKFYSEYHRSVQTSTPVHFEEFYPEPLNVWVECHGYPSAGGLSIYFRDITERKRAETDQALLTKVLHVLSSGGALRPTVAEVVRLIREMTGFNAVGLRLRQDGDFPYYEQNGFSDDFLTRENFLCAECKPGAAVDGADGRAVLECTCGYILSGRTDAGMSCFTEFGSFWTNASSELLALGEADPRINPRNTCIHKGYQSIGLFPVRAGKEVIGLLQLNDPRKGLFTPQLIAFFESLAQNVGLALQRTIAEEELRESMHRLEMAQQIAHLGSWELDLTKNQLRWSDEVYRIFGLEPQEFSATYEAFLEAIHPADRAAVDAAYAGSLRENLNTYEIEHRIIRKSTGEVRFVHEKCEHFRDGSGRIVRSLGMILDITDRKQAEEQLRQLNETLEQRVHERTADLSNLNLQLRSEIEQRSRAERAAGKERQKLKNILDSMQDGVYIVDRNYMLQYVNPSIEQQFGAVDGRKCFEYFHDRGIPCAWCNSQQVFEAACLRWECHSEKTNRTYDIYSTPFLNEDGTISKLDILRDITRRRRAEKALAQSEERHRMLVETMNEGLVVADENDVWTYVNTKLCTMLGYPREEIVGRSCRHWLDEANQKILDAQSRKRIQGAVEPYEIAWTRRDGSPVITQVSPCTVFNERGEYTGSFAVLTDITERKKAEASLQKALSEIKTLKERVEAENVYFQKEIKMTKHFDHIIGQSNAFKYVLYRAEQVAPTSATVLILGETGTGKGVLAAAIHQMSSRRERPLVTVNCAALPANLIESELFGRERGAYTGSDGRQVGRFEIADGSTICLDEVAELPLEVQAKLLRAIQHNEFERLGSSRTIKVNARIVATTNRSLEQEVREGRFREDLFYRLNVFPLTVPPLRKRKEDIPALVQALTERYGRKLGKRFSSVSREAMQQLMDYDWPGNIRELENVIERAVILSPGPVLHLTDKLERDPLSQPGVLKTMEEAERDQILRTLSQTGWRINGPNGAADILDLPPSTLRSRMHKLGIRRPR